MADITEIDENIIEKGNAISIGDTTATCFYQSEQFISGDHIVIIRAEWLNKYSGLFIKTLLNKERYKYSYGRAFLIDRIKNTYIKLPILRANDGTPFIDESLKYHKDGYLPDWKFIEMYMKSLKSKQLTTNNSNDCVLSLKTQNWNEYKISDIFPKIKLPKHSVIPDSEGKYEFISSTCFNNGVAKKVNETPVKGNCITVSTNGDCFDCFYHDNPIVISNDVEVLYSKYLNKYTAIFICTILNKEKYKWSYGRKPKNDKVYETIINLPSTEEGKPDWVYMENYIKSLPYGDRL